MAITEESAREALKQVIDPEFVLRDSTGPAPQR